MKKLIALVLSLCMVLTIGAAFADDPAPAGDDAAPAATYSGTISVSNLDNGDEVSFYQIVKWVGETTDDSDVTGWKAISPYDTVLTKDVLTEVLLGTWNATEKKYENPTNITPELAGQLAKKVTSTSAKVGNAAVTAASNKASVTTNEPGIFMALVKPIKADTLYNPIFVSVDYTKSTNDQAASNYADTDSTAKKSTLTITKTAANASDYTPDNGKTTAVGDTLNFTVNTKIPAYGAVYTNPHFVVKDTLTDLELVVSSIKVNGQSSSDNWSASATTAGYTITFDPDYLKTIATAQDVVITYSAKVTSSAVKAINEENNDVVLEYSHDPSNENDFDVQKDTTQHYTFTIDAAGLGEHTSVEGKKTSEVVKIGLDADGNPINQTTLHSEITDTNTWSGPLQGAQFGLWKTSDCSGDPILTQTTGADGRMTFAGLDAGTYYLKEISAPAGFVTNTDIHTIVLAATLKSVKVTEYYDPADGKWYSENGTGRKAATYDTEILDTYTVTIDNKNVSTYEFKNEDTANDNEIKWTTLDPVELPCQLTNIKGVELPSTGGIGTTIFYVVGGLLLVGAAIILVSRRKAHD